MITTKTRSTGDLITPSSSSMSTASSVQSLKSNNTATSRRRNVQSGSLRSRPIKQKHNQHSHQRPPLKPRGRQQQHYFKRRIANNNNNNNNNNNSLKREYKIRQSQTLLLLLTTTISFLLFLLFTLPFYALVGLTIMITFLGLGIVVATSALKTRYLLELEHPLGLLKYLPEKVRVPLTEKSLHDCLISPSTSLSSLKSLDRSTSGSFGGGGGGGGGNNSSNHSSKNSLVSLNNNNSKGGQSSVGSGSNHSSMDSLGSYNNNKHTASSSSSSLLSYPRKVSSKQSLLPPPPPPPPPLPDRDDEEDDDIKMNNSREFSCSGFDIMRQATVKKSNKTTTMKNQEQQLSRQYEKENGDNEKRSREGRSDRYSIYQTNERVIR